MKAARPNAALVEAARRGDFGALEKLLETCRPDLRRYAAINCLAADVEDAVQESLLILYRKVGALRSISAFPRWLFQIVRHECLRLSRQIMPEQLLWDKVEKVALDKSDADLRFDITRAIQSLPDRYRDIIVLRDFEELPIAEIATRLNMEPATVKTRVHRGRQLIREHLRS